MRYSIAPMSISDFDEVQRLWQSAKGVGPNESDSPANLAIFLDRNPGMSFVARNGMDLVGAVLCGHDGRRGSLNHLAVASPHRRKGIGRKLVAACFSELAKCGILKCNIF